MRLIDTHTHLTHADYNLILPAVIARAKQAGVSHYVVPGLDLSTSNHAIALANQYRPYILPAVGLHPLSPAESLEPFKELIEHVDVKAVGEIGTDAKAGTWSEQEERFRFFLELAIRYDKPVLIHIRDTWEETFTILKDYPELENKAVIHCFTGDFLHAQKIASLGLLLSVTAIIVRSAMSNTREVIKMWPLDRLMLETDSPWLMWPGEEWPNEPKTVAQIAQYVAELKGLSMDDVARATTQTAMRFFNFEG